MIFAFIFDFIKIEVLIINLIEIMSGTTGPTH